MLFLLGWALAGCFIVVTVVLFVAGGRQRKEIALERARTESVSRDLEAEKRWGSMLASPSVRAASFTLTQAAASGLRGRATVDPGTHRALLVFDNVTSPVGGVYELWALHGVTPVAVARIRPDLNGHAVLRIENVGDPATLTAFVVSLEQDAADAGEGAAAAARDSVLTATAGREPTGAIVMIGSLGN